MTERPLATSEARDVLAAVVAGVARDAGLDVLLIKGPSLSHHGLRAVRAWGDVDVLVRPDHAGPLRRALEPSGWEPFDESPAYPLITPPHAITLIHARWHTEIDVHTFIPGTYARADTTFALLWEEQTSITLAHQPVPCTGRIGSALVAGLNLMRTPTSHRTSAEMVQWQAAVSAWADADRAELRELAGACGAADILAPLLAEVGIPAIGTGMLTAANWSDWNDRVGREAQRGYAWAMSLRRAPLRQKPALALRALTYDPAAAADGRTQPTGLARLRLVARRLALALTVALRRSR